jgi:DNA-binding NtrC family response regulator
MGLEAPCRILTVDDEASVTLSLKFVFPKPRYEVLCVASGDAALASLAADANPYDVIIVDQKMPNLSGVQLVEAIRQRGIPGEIIVLSAHLTSEMKAEYERLNVHTIFPKPFDLNALRDVVGHLASPSAVEGGDPDGTAHG